MYSLMYEIYLKNGSVIKDFFDDLCFVNGFIYAHGKTLSVYDIEYVIIKWVNVDEYEKK